MSRFAPFFLIIFAAGALSACAQTVPRSTEAGALVDKARWTIEEFKQRQEKPNQLFRANLAAAKGIAIFPAVTKGAFVVGAEGGPGVVVVRNADGSWGYPAFYTLGAGSFGLQIGFQSAEVVLILRSERAVLAVVQNQGKFGGDMQLTVGELGAGVEAATTTNLGADIVGFAHATGVYGGLSLEGAGIVRRNDLNQAYYGKGATPESILLQKRFSNPQAELLRQALAGD